MLRKRYRGLLYAINNFGIRVFSETSNMLSLGIFELFYVFYVLNITTSNILSFGIFLCAINLATSTASSVILRFFLILTDTHTVTNNVKM